MRISTRTTSARPPTRPAFQDFEPPAALALRDVRARVHDALRAQHLDGRLTLEEVCDEFEERDEVAPHAVMLARGRVGECEGGASGSKRAREEEDRPVVPKEFTFEVTVAPTQARTVRIELTTTTCGEASAAFWRLALALRNDVVRDTRKWRRREQRGAASA